MIGRTSLPVSITSATFRSVGRPAGEDGGVLPHKRIRIFIYNSSDFSCTRACAFNCVTVLVFVRVEESLCGIGVDGRRFWGRSECETTTSQRLNESMDWNCDRGGSESVWKDGIRFLLDGNLFTRIDARGRVGTDGKGVGGTGRKLGDDGARRRHD